MVVAELGQTADPKALIGGDPAAVRATIGVLDKFGDALVTAGNGLIQLDDGGWTGQAADAFHEWFDGEPARWIGCGEAFSSAATALTIYVGVLEWAQGQAGEAIRLWSEAQAATARAKADHQREVEAANQQAAAAGTVAPSIPFVDPGEAKRTEAQGLLATARSQLHTAGEQANTTVGQARDKAPEKPSLLGRIGETLGDFGRGVWESVTGLAGAGSLGDFLEHLPRRIELLFEEVTELSRHTRIVIKEVADGVVRHVDEITIDEFLRVTRWMGRTIDLEWLRGASRWLKKLGPVGDALAGPLAAREQWEEDANRTDLSSTERWWRALADGVTRGLYQIGLGVATSAAASAAAPFGGPVAVVAIQGAGIVQGELHDWALESILDWSYEQLDWYIEGQALLIDESGRWIGDRIDVQNAAEVARADNRVENVGDVGDAVTPW
ncbi:MAG: putative T7SS-secreted protein [Egibacteraceae bacterium]